MTALATRPYPVKLGLLGQATLVAHHREGADLGFAFHWEERCWLQDFGIKDQVAYRKRARTQDYAGKLCREWSLNVDRFAVPGHDQHALRTPVMDSTMLLAWFFGKYHHFDRARDEWVADRCRIALESYCSVAARASMACDGVGMDVKGNHIKLDKDS